MEYEIKKDLYKREKYLNKIRGFYHESEIIKVLTGVRRCGKSSIMNLIAGELIESGVEDEPEELGGECLVEEANVP